MAPAAMRTAASSLSGVKPVPFWLDDPERPDALPALTGDEHTDLLVVGGGYSGLWTALIAKERDPDRDVVLIEGHEVGWAASGRNGGFLRRLPHPRAGQRRGALARRDREAGGAGGAEPRRHRGRRRPLRHRLRVRAHR